MENKIDKQAYKIIIALLVLAIIVLSWLVVKDKTTLNSLTIEKEQQKTILQSELDSLVNEHEKVKTAYGDISDKLKQKDSIIQINAEEIRHLISVKAGYKRVKNKLELLRKISQGYVHQIDSLYRVNQELREENVQIKSNYEQEQRKSTQIAKDRDELKGKVNRAAVLKAYNIMAKGIHLKSGGKKEEETDKIRRVDKIKVCFTISENPLVSAGNTSVYVRIARPDNKVLAKGLSDDYSFYFNNEKLQYSIRHDFAYANKLVDLCLYWTNRDDSQLVEGKYNISIYCGDFLIGESSFTLK